MASITIEASMALRAQIKDNFRYVYDLAGADPIIAIATHDHLHWVIVRAKDAPQFLYSLRGHKTEEDALEQMAYTLRSKVWQKAKDSQITLSK